LTSFNDCSNVHSKIAKMTKDNTPRSWTRFDLNLFRVFEAIYTQSSLTKAAEVLHLSQPAISHSLSRLREQLGDVLFVRGGNGVRPSATAVRIWPEIQHALSLMRHAIRHMDDFDPARDVKEVRIAINDEGESLILPSLVQLIHGQAPAVKVHCINLDRASMRSDLSAGRIDCAIDIAQPTNKEIRHASIKLDDYVVVRRNNMNITAIDYLKAAHITVSSRRTGRSIEDLALAKNGIERQVLVRCQRYEAACQIVARSDMILTMPRSVAETIACKLDLFLVDLPLPISPIDMHVYWHAPREPEPINGWIREMVSIAAMNRPELRADSND
jgi:DNA-binding transcriptional LysR family regulator